MQPHVSFSSFFSGKCRISHSKAHVISAVQKNTAFPDKKGNSQTRVPSLELLELQIDNKLTTSQCKTHLSIHKYSIKRGHGQGTPKSSIPPTVLHFMATPKSSKRENLVAIQP